MVFGIVTAGGVGTRLLATVPKLEVEILGRPMLFYALEAFERCSRVDRVVVTVPPERIDHWALDRFREEGLEKVVACVGGGATRQESVSLALEELPGDGGAVVVHDAARPMVTPAMIDAVSVIPEGAEGVITVIRVTDTIKEVEGGTVTQTLDRERLVAIQTPQCFPLSVLRSAHTRASLDGFTGTDDAQLVERIGGRIRVMDGSRDNFKVTFPEDVERAETAIKARRES